MRSPHLDHDTLCGSHGGSLLISAFKKQLSVHLPGMQLADTASASSFFFEQRQQSSWELLSQWLGMAMFLCLAILPSGASSKQVSMLWSSLLEWPKLCWISVMIRGSCCWIWLPWALFLAQVSEWRLNLKVFPAHQTLSSFKLHTFPPLLPWPYKPLELHSIPASTSQRM